MLKDTPLQEIIEELGLPKNTTFLGYVIRLPKNDEFLGNYHIDLDAVSMMWTKVPDMASVFDSVESAQQVISQLDKPGTMLGWLFDLGKQFYVVSLKQDDKDD